MEVNSKLVVLGDSMMVRLCKKKRQPTHGDLTVSGQCSSQLLRKLKKLRTNGRLPIVHEAVIMIGTNDILKGKSTSTIASNIRSILFYLLLCAERVVLFTLPPIPRMGEPLPVLRLNAAIRKLAAARVSVVDVHALFVDAQGAVDSTLFERVMGANRRPDKIHWNARGMDRAFQLWKSAPQPPIGVHTSSIK